MHLAMAGEFRAGRRRPAGRCWMAARESPYCGSSYWSQKSPPKQPAIWQPGSAGKWLPCERHLLCRKRRYAIHHTNRPQGQIMQKLPAQMTVIGISKPGGPEVLLPETRPVPVPGPGEILVKVEAAGVNRPDVAQRSGSYPPPPGASDLPGLEIAGVVVALGAGASKHKLGDKVMSLVAGGGYAPYCIAQDAQAMAVPEALSMPEAGAIPETLMTVWHNVFERGALKAGETLLIHGGSSGIGTMAIQLAKSFGAKRITTAGTPDKCQACRALGADVAVNYKDEDFVAVTKAASHGRGADVILDMVGGDYIERKYEAAAV